MIERRPIDPYLRKQPWAHPPGLGPTGRRLCCCGCGREVGKHRSSSYDNECVDWWKSHSDLNGIKFQVLQRDKGMCTICAADTVALKAQYEAALHRVIGNPDCWSHRGAEMDSRAKEIVRLRQEAGWPDTGRQWWEADHVVPVAEGGGGCDFNGYRTLCLPCHRKETAALRKRMSAAVLTPCCRLKPAILQEGPVATVRCECGITHRYDQRRRTYESYVASTHTLLIKPDMWDVKP